MINNRECCHCLWPSRDLPPQWLSHPRRAEVACIPDALRSGKDLSACFAVFSLLHSQFFPSTTGSTRDKKNISVLMSGKGFDARLSTLLNIRALWWIPSLLGPDLSVWYKQGRLCLHAKKCSPGVCAPYLLIQDSWFCLKLTIQIHRHVQKVVKILLYNQLYPVWKRWFLLLDSH